MQELYSLQRNSFFRFGTINRKSLFQFILPALVIFSIIHFNSEVLRNLLQGSFHFDNLKTTKVLHYLIPFKVVFFIIAIISLIFPLPKELFIIFSPVKSNDLFIPLIAFCILQLAFWNFRPMSMGYGYAEMSVHPFDMPTGWYYKRLLMPAIAYLTGFRDIILYFIFSSFLSYVFLLLIWIFLKQQFSHIGNLKVFLVFISVCSLECVTYLFFFPGYPDHLLSIFILLLYCFPLSERSKLSLIILAVATHDVSLFIFLPVILFQLNVNNRSLPLICFGIYGLFYLLAFQFNIPHLFAVHKIENSSPLQWAKQNPALLLSGFLIAFKLLWLIIIYGIRLAEKSTKPYLLTLLSVAFLVSLMGVDTSRLVAFGFPLLLLLLKPVYEKINSKIFFGIIVANLLIPYLNISLNMGIIKVIYFKDFLNCMMGQ